MWKEFKEFAFKGNVIDLAVGVMIGGAFGKIVSSLVNDIFMPLIGLIIGNLDIAAMYITFDGKTYESAEAATEAGAAVLNYGQFIATVVDFLLIALVIFIFVKLINKLRLGKKTAAEADSEPPRLCDFCKQEVAKDATRCPHCTSHLEK